MSRQRIAAAMAVVFYFYTAAACADAGLEWLASQTRSDGSVGTGQGIATALQAASETSRAFRAAAYSDGVTDGVRSYVGAAPAAGVEAISRKLIAAAAGGTGVASLIQSLDAYQRADGGFAAAAQDGNPLDTAFALQALSTAGAGGSAAARAAVAYLSASQASDGGWPGTAASASLYVTALAAAALVKEGDIGAAAASKARAALLSRRGTDGRWGEDFLGALALLALIQTPDDAARLADSIAALRDRQAADGSWSDDAYTTALAERALLQAAHPPALARLGSIAGRALDGDTGLGLSGVAVTLTGPTAGNTGNAAMVGKLTTRSDGAFQFERLMPGGYRIALIADGYAAVSSATIVTAGEHLDLGTVPLLKLPTAAGGSITGTISDAAHGTPLADVSVAVAGLDPAVTDAQGRYLIGGVPPGVLTVTASRDGYSTASVQADIVDGGVFVFSASLTPVAAATTAVVGTVTDALTAQPLPGVDVELTGAASGSAATDTQGRYRIADLSPGAASLSAAAPGYDDARIAVTVGAGAVTQVSPRLYPAGTSPADSNTQAVRGVVVDAVTGEALPGAAVSAAYGAASAMAAAGPDGSFLITGITASSASLHIHADGYVDRSLSLALAPLATLDLGRIRLRPTGVTQLLPDLTVTALAGDQAVDDAATLQLSGTLTITVANAGSAAAAPAAVNALYDVDKNGRFDEGRDIALGQGATGSLEAGARQDLTIALSGRLPYRDAPVTVLVDSAMAIPELDEANNTRRSLPPCTAQGSAPPGIEAAPGYRVSLYAGHVTGQSGPTALALDRAGRVYFTGGDSGAAFVIPADGGVPVPFGTADIADTDGLTIDSRDNVIVAGVPITKFAPDQSVLWSHSCPIGNIQSAAVDADDNIYVGSLGTSICKISPDGRQVEIFGGFNAPSNPVVGPDGNLYVAEYGPHDIVKADSRTGARLGIVVPDILATQLAFTADGTLLAGDYTAGSVVAIDPATGRMETLVSGFPQPQALAVSTAVDGDLYVGDQANKAVYKVSRIDTAAADLTLGRLTFTDHGAGQGITVAVRAGNAGGTDVAAGVPVAFYDGDPAAGGTLLGRAALGAVPADSWQDLSLDGVTALSGAEVYAVVDPDHPLSECRRGNDSVHAPVPAGRLGALGVATDHAVYGPGVDAVFTAVVRNTGLLPGAFQTVFHVEDSAGALVQVLGPVTAGVLPSGAGATLSTAWDTGTILAGDYVLRGILETPQGEAIAQAAVPFTIRHADDAGPPASLWVGVDRPRYAAGDSAAVTARVQNTTLSTVIDAAVVQLTVTAPDGAAFLQSDIPVVQLLPGALHSYPLRLPLSGASPGQYAVEARLLRGGKAIAAAAPTAFAVQSDPPAALDARVAVQDASLYQGTAQICTLTVTDRSPLEVDTGLRVSLIDMQSGERVVSQDAHIAVAAGASATLVQSLATAGMAPGEYACTWSQGADSSRTLGYAPFALERPPIRIDAHWSVGARGRLLVLMPPPRGAHGYADPTATGGDRRSRLDGWLDDRGWDHTIVSDADAFTDALRSGAYTVYLLSGDTAPLPLDAQRELREAVYRGAGLMVAGHHDAAERALTAALGIDLHDHGLWAGGLTLLDSPLTAAGTAAFHAPLRVTGLRLAGAVAAANYDLVPLTWPGHGEDEKDGDDQGPGDGESWGDDQDRDQGWANEYARDDDEDEIKNDGDAQDRDDGDDGDVRGRTVPAISYYHYGDGRSVYAGIDLTALAGSSGMEAGYIFGQVLSGGLDWAAPAPPRTTDAVLPLVLRLRNQGIAVSGRAVVSLPPGVQVYDPGQAIPTDGGTWEWPFDLAVDATQQFTLWARLPDTAGDLPLAVALKTGTGNEAPYTDLDLDIATTAPPSLADAIAAASAYGLQDGAPLRDILAAQRALTAGRPWTALHALLKAADRLDRMPAAVPIHDARLAVDYAIRRIERRLPPLAHGRAAEHHGGE